MTETEGFRQHRYEPPAGATTILLVRHGESEPAIPGRPFPLVGGHGDPALHPDGRAQAEQVAVRLKSERIDAIYVTTLRRTHETAAPLAVALGLTAVVEPDLREVFLGDWEGGEFRARAAASDPAWVRMNTEQRWDAVPNGESHASLVARTGAALARIVAAHPDGRVVAVVHGGIVATLLAQASGSQPFAFLGAENASISELVVHEGRSIVRRFNDCAHLP
jgi:2,3-bisphosphoglycerate-dependent phosphoglycerate mutase